jgi:hypothetical protein
MRCGEKPPAPGSEDSNSAAEIGLMKTVGARTRQVAAVHVGTVVVLSAIALVVVFPGYPRRSCVSSLVFELRNLEVESYAIDPWVIPVQILASVEIPLLAVPYSVAIYSRRSVRKVLTDHGTAAGAKPGRWLVDCATWGGRLCSVSATPSGRALAQCSRRLNEQTPETREQNK